MLSFRNSTLFLCHLCFLANSAELCHWMVHYKFFYFCVYRKSKLVDTTGHCLTRGIWIKKNVLRDHKLTWTQSMNNQVSDTGSDYPLVYNINVLSNFSYIIHFFQCFLFIIFWLLIFILRFIYSRTDDLWPCSRLFSFSCTIFILKQKQKIYNRIGGVMVSVLACWSSTKRTSSSSHWQLPCSRHDIAEKLLSRH